MNILFNNVEISNFALSSGKVEISKSPRYSIKLCKYNNRNYYFQSPWLSYSHNDIPTPIPELSMKRDYIKIPLGINYEQTNFTNKMVEIDDFTTKNLDEKEQKRYHSLIKKPNINQTFSPYVKMSFNIEEDYLNINAFLNTDNVREKIEINSISNLRSLLEDNNNYRVIFKLECLNFYEEKSYNPIFWTLRIVSIDINKSKPFLGYDRFFSKNDSTEFSITEPFECSICLSDNCTGKCLYKCCNQISCQDCNISWLDKDDSCPFCRRNLC